LLYELLTGVLPVAPRRETRAAIEEAILEGDTVLASTRVKDKATARALRGELDAILSKAMQRDPQRRYATADAMAQDIERYLQGETVSARPDSLVYRMHKAIRRHWVGVSAVTAVLIAVLSGSAVALVQAQRAARASERERVVREFVADVFRVNSHVTTDHAAVKSASSESLLEGGAQLIQQRFAGQPDMQAELFGVVGGVFSDMGAYKLAADYATHRIEALNLSHADDIEQVQALLALAQALFDDNKLADAEVRLREVLKLSKHEPPLRLNALVLLARLQLGMEHLKEALVTQQELEAQVNSGVAPPIVKAWSVFLRASILEMQNQFDRTLPIYQKAINQALLAEGPLSTTAVSMRLVAVRKIIHYGDVNLAQEYFAAADKALRELGAGHGVRATYEAALFQYMLLQSRAIGPREAMRKILQYRDTLAASELSIPAWYIPECDRLLAMIKMESGDLAGGLPLYESSQALLRKMLGPDNDRRHSATYLGMMMEAAGRHEIADRLLREALEIAKAEGLGLHPYATSEYFWISDNLRMWGRYSEADKFLSAVPKFEKLQGGGPSEGNWSKYLAWERAKLQLDVGNANLSTKILKDNPPEKGDQTDLNWYNQALGEALCSGGQAKEGLSLLKQTVTFLDSLDEYSYSPDYGRLWGDIALCTLATGELKTALLYAEKARVVFKEQPGMSPYFKRPLEQFERQWGTRQGLMKG
jgi:tetratricopeptide (TPR) repeat protein